MLDGQVAQLEVPLDWLVLALPDRQHDVALLRAHLHLLQPRPRSYHRPHLVLRKHQWVVGSVDVPQDE